MRYKKPAILDFEGSLRSAKDVPAWAVSAGRPPASEIDVFGRRRRAILFCC